jgi:uncharacterized membrane protein YsdA (DUF1294 family)
MQWSWIAAWYGLASLVSFAVYWFDKSRARAGGRRVRERTLHLLDLGGGWPGGLFARGVLRHKTIDVKFRILSALIIALHALAWCGFFWVSTRH